MTEREKCASGRKRTLAVSLRLSPPSGEMPKAEGEAVAVYFAMNISRELGDIHLSGKSANDARLRLGASITAYEERNIVFHSARAAIFASLEMASHCILASLRS